MATQDVQFQGKVYQLPAEWSDEQIAAYLQKIAERNARPDLYAQAKKMYPRIPGDLGFKMNPGGGEGQLEYWPAGESGTPERPRPQDFPMEQAGVEVYNPKARPEDIAGDIVSHGMIHGDPVISKVYQHFVENMTPEQKAKLREQYAYAQRNYGETRPFEKWAEMSGLPGWFRGFMFGQWKNPEKIYTPDQMYRMRQAQDYLRGADPNLVAQDAETGAETVAEPTEEPKELSRNEYADKRVEELNAKIKEHMQALDGLQSQLDETADPNTDMAAVQRDMAQHVKAMRALQDERDKYQIGTKGQTIGSLVGAVGGGTLGGMFGGPIGAALGTVGGSALGTYEGMKLMDIPKARQARDISPQEAEQMARTAAVNTAIIDGAFVLLLGPAGQVIARTRAGEGLLQALKNTGKNVFGWDQVKKALEAQSARTVARKAQHVDKDALSPVSKGLGMTKEAPPGEAERVLGEIEKRSGQVPSKGKLTGLAEHGETFERTVSGHVFHRSEEAMNKAITGIKNDALSVLDDAGAMGRIDLGANLQRVQKVADARLKQITGPIFNRTRELGMQVDMTKARDLIKETLERDVASKERFLKPNERAELERLYKLLGGEGDDAAAAASSRDELNALFGDTGKVAEAGDHTPFMSMEGAQDMISGNKRSLREMVDGSGPSKPYQRVLSQINDEADARFLEAAGKADPEFRKELIGARDLYRKTFEDLYSDGMVRMAQKTPEDVGRYLTTNGTITEIRQMRKLLDRAVDLSKRKGRGQAITETQRRRIDAGLVKGFIEENTKRLTELPTKMASPTFTDTLKELMLGSHQKTINAPLYKGVIKDLDAAFGALGALHKEVTMMARPQTVLGGLGLGSIGGGTVLVGATGMSIRSAAALAIPIMAVGKLLANGAAKAMTTGNAGLLNRVARAIYLSRHALTNEAAAQLSRKAWAELQPALQEIQQEEDQRNQQPPRGVDAGMGMVRG